MRERRGKWRSSDGCSDAAAVEEKVVVTLLLLEDISLVLRLLPCLPACFRKLNGLN